MSGQISKEQFIESLNLPDGVWPKHFEGMNRYHFKYCGVGFVVLDLRNNYYHLRAREEYLKAVGVSDYTIDKNHSPNSGTLKCIPYDNTDVFYRLVRFITNEDIDNINTPKNPLSVLNNKQYVCPRCKKAFLKAPRCPECGQLIKE